MSDSDASDAASIIDVDFDFNTLETIVDPPVTLSPFLRILLGRTTQLPYDELAVFMVEEQGKIGSVICAPPENMDDEDEEQDVLGVLTLLPLSHPKLTPVLNHFTLLASSSVKAVDILGRTDIAWCFSERLLNIPPQVTLPCYDMLMKETSHVNLVFMVWICKTYTMVQDHDSDDDDKRRKKRLDGKSRKKVRTEYYYHHAEEELIATHAEVVVDLEWNAEVKRELKGDDGIREGRRMVIVRRDVFCEQVLPQLQSMLGDL